MARSIQPISWKFCSCYVAIAVVVVVVDNDDEDDNDDDDVIALYTKIVSPSHYPVHQEINPGLYIDIITNPKD